MSILIFLKTDLFADFIWNRDCKYTLPLRWINFTIPGIEAESEGNLFGSNQVTRDVDLKVAKIYTQGTNEFNKCACNYG